MSEGWIKLNRKLLQSPCFLNRELLQVWIWLLLSVNHEEGKAVVGLQVIPVKPGQVVTGRNKVAEATGLNRSKIERLLKVLENEQQIEQQTFTKFRIITITNWNRYQCFEQQSEQQVSNKRATSEHKQECKEEKNKTLSSSEDEVDEKSYLSKKGKRLSGKRLESFERFWSAFDYKHGKAEAADAWMSIPMLTDAIVDRIVAAASMERSRRPDIIKQNKTPKMAQGWLSGRRWEDEASAIQDEPVPAMRGVI